MHNSLLAVLVVVLVGLPGAVSAHSTYSARPSSYTDLLQYVQPGPDQGETGTCLFVGSTGAMELLLNRLHGITNPVEGGDYDLSERFLIHAPDPRTSKSFFEDPVRKFNYGYAMLQKVLPFKGWLDPEKTVINWGVWDYPSNFRKLDRIKVPPVKTRRLFRRGGIWDMYVVQPQDIELIKETLWKEQNPVLINYNDEDYWHVITIVGYDDDAVGDCYDTPPKECEGRTGAFYIRDSFGISIEKRSYDWFRVNGNAAYVVGLATEKSVESFQAPAEGPDTEKVEPTATRSTSRPF